VVDLGTAADKILKEALSLPADERASLVERLLQSLNLPTEAEVTRLWAEEAERRVAQLEAGEVELIPGEQVFAKIRAKYRG
jgi:putative addiction module component (TIGR02574 family)